MTSRDQVKTLFAEANPIPDPDLIDMDVRAGLAQLEQRSIDMVQQTDQPAHTSPMHRRAAPWLVAAAVAAVIALAAIVISLTGNDPPVADSADTTMLEQPRDPAVAAVVTAVEALNSGDAGAWAAAQADPAAERYTYNRALTTGEIVGGTYYFMEWWVAANGRWDIVEPCEVASGAPLVVHCTIEMTSDWQQPAGLSGTGTYSFWLNDDLRITRWDSEDPPCCTEQYNFNRQFYAWLRETHRDVYESILPVDQESFPGVARVPSDMTTALEYLEEFLAQSDEYPIEGG